MYPGSSNLTAENTDQENSQQNALLQDLDAPTQETIFPLTSRLTTQAYAIPDTDPTLESASKINTRVHISSPSPELSSIINTSRLPSAEKGSDNTNIPVTPAIAHHLYTPSTLSQLFGASFKLSPDASRHNSALDNASLLRKANDLDSTSLNDHLYTKGLLAGRHSDITINAFQSKYNLHRLILDRAPFFALAFSGPWAESRSKEINLTPEAIDPAITQNAFDLALRKLYGCDISDQLDGEAVALFATGCWLEMQEIIDAAIESILRNMTPESLGSIINIVTVNFYGRHGARVLASAKAMLCREGWDMPFKYWDAVPAEIIREIVSSDGFFVNSEWDRWNHARKLVERRLRTYSLKFDVTIKNEGSPLHILQWLPRFGYNTSSQIDSKSNTSSTETDNDKWFSLYTHHDIEPLFRLIDGGIHYIHLEFEHLQYIKQCRDIFGLPSVPESVIMNALFLQLELRQKIVNAKSTDIELGLTTPITHHEDKENTSDTSDEDQTKTIKRNFYIPSADCNLVMGGSAEPVVANGGTSDSSRIAARISNLTTGNDWIDDNDSTVVGAANSNTAISKSRPPPSAFTNYPPFRFSASFPAPRLLKEKKRLYSRTVFYAGSLWNVYIQKQRSNRRYELGVYLHRAKERDLADDMSYKAPVSVDERIGILEREMLLRGDLRSPRGISRSSGQARASPAPNGLTYIRPLDRQSSTQAMSLSPNGWFQEESDSENSDASDTTAPATANIVTDESSSSNTQPPFKSPKVASLPPYNDYRPTIRTYFKIYSPSKAGRFLSVYESAPDDFDFSQSWGWRSSTLMLDEGLEEEEEEDSNFVKKGRSSGVLRFCIVLGNL